MRPARDFNGAGERPMVGRPKPEKLRPTNGGPRRSIASRRRPIASPVGGAFPFARGRLRIGGVDEFDTLYVDLGGQG